MNDVFKITINAIITPHDIEAHPDTWTKDDFLGHLVASPELVRSVEVTELVPKAEAQPVVKLEVVPEPQPQPEPEPEPQPAIARPVAVSAKPKQSKYLSRRTHRLRVTDGVPLIEYCYTSYDYRDGAYRLEIALPTTHENKDCVWLTREEAARIKNRIMEARAERLAKQQLKRNAGGE
jgi:hypothetical protein